jgi:hypothetical protein
MLVLSEGTVAVGVGVALPLALRLVLSVRVASAFAEAVGVASPLEIVSHWRSLLHPSPLTAHPSSLNTVRLS